MGILLLYLALAMAFTIGFLAGVALSAGRVTDLEAEIDRLRQRLSEPVPPERRTGTG